MSSAPPGSRVCATTGLTLIPASGEQVWRIAKTSYGPLNPPLRGPVGDDPQEWGRFDTYGGRTVYGSSSAECAYSEMLAYLRRRLGELDSLSKDAAAVGMTVEQLASVINEEWGRRGHMALGHLAKGWRMERTLYELRLPADGWWVNLESPESMAAAEAAIGDELASVGVGSLDLGALHGDGRAATVALATWARGLILDDGSLPCGITFTSKHATGRAWAYWLRKVDDGGPIADEPIRLVSERSIEAEDAALVRVADRFGIKIW